MRKRVPSPFSGNDNYWEGAEVIYVGMYSRRGLLVGDRAIFGAKPAEDPITDEAKLAAQRFIAAAMTHPHVFAVQAAVRCNTRWGEREGDGMRLEVYETRNVTFERDRGSASWTVIDSRDLPSGPVPDILDTLIMRGEA